MLWPRYSPRAQATLTGQTMKKFSTATRLLALASFFVPLIAAAAEPNVPAGASKRCEFLQSAPDQHVVMRGDTLWGISSKFLNNPWCWPQVWGVNREQIRNPHWIYPGQIVYFDRVAGRLHLGNPINVAPAAVQVDGKTSGDVHLVPQQRIQGLGREAVPAIPAGIIEPFLSQPLIVDDGDLDDSLRIVATQEGRVNIGIDDKAYVMGDLNGGTSFQAFRPGRPLKDPENNQIIGHEAMYLGTLKLLQDGDATKETHGLTVAHSFTVVSAKEEMGVGDLLTPVKPVPFLNYMPHPPEQEIQASVVSIYGGVKQAGQNQVISINRGKNDGLDIGAVLELYRHGEVMNNKEDKKKQFKIPDEQYGKLFIFRVFNRISYGLVMQVRESVQVGDVAKSPE